MQKEITMLDGCPICQNAMEAVSCLPQGKLYRCPKCFMLVSPDNPLTPKPRLVDEELSNEYLAIVQKASDAVNIKHPQKALDIYSGDGSLLGWYMPTIMTVGVEPDTTLLTKSLNAKKLDWGINSLFTLEAVKSNASFGSCNFKIITVINVLQNELYPLEFMGNCKELLDPEGVLIIQVPYLPHMLNANEDQVFVSCRNYFLSFVLKTIVEALGLGIQGVELIANKIRYYITHVSYTDKFLASDYAEKLKLYMGLSNSIVSTEYAKRFHTLDAYRRVEQVLCVNKPQMRGET